MNENCWLKDRCNRIDCARYCQRYDRLSALYDNALISSKQREHVTLRLGSKELDKNAFIKLNEISKDIVNFVAAGRNVFIFSSNVGNGKTTWTLRLIECYFDEIWAKTPYNSCKALFINVPRFLLSLKDNISNKNDYIRHIKENMLDCDVIIWDDIGTKTITSFESENLLSIIDTRINAGKSNFYTSNISGQELRESLGDRLYSRIVDLSENIEFKEADMRKLGK